MNLPAKRRQPSRLPKHFPIGTTYVVEGRGGENGHLRVFSRYVVLPSGQRINVAGDSPSVSASLPVVECARTSAECQTDSSLQQSMPVLGQVLPDFR